MTLFLTDGEAAVKLGISRQLIRRLAREGRIPHFKLGRQIRFDADLLDKWVQEQSLASLRSTDLANQAERTVTDERDEKELRVP